MDRAVVDAVGLIVRVQVDNVHFIYNTIIPAYKEADIQGNDTNLFDVCLATKRIVVGAANKFAHTRRLNDCVLEVDESGHALHDASAALICTKINVV
jgi:hypothetical protein